ncbi:DNA-binding transcriptional ArsR family regulator [Sphingomonas vulcanisoli]|uniref:DNA-binding transcriptional ArsR family regulator n=1 Tax=Sphingomonas vulcanisoli TaxID=1658060 RepID=A0ABX0TV22_9SPHN|nr:hypothetical protein [Sphingomonas vulcanisoli]NIJ09343.1 DNA-binding transcriptional ArsR family regulator [Sphingomonas vulcanisoli]
MANDGARRDALLVLLSERGQPAMKRAAAQLVKATKARRRFNEEQSALIEIADEALSLAEGPSGRIAQTLIDCGGHSLPLVQIARTVDRLRLDPDFAEAMGSEVRHAMPRGTFSHYVPAAPGAAWALNVALLLKGSPHAALPAPGLVGRTAFRPDLENEELCDELIGQAASAMNSAESLFEQTSVDLTRGREMLGHLSRNASAFEAWKLVAAVKSITRSQLAGALGLSRAGADIQARVLAEAGLVELGRNGRIDWKRKQPRSLQAPQPLPEGLSQATAEVDASLAELDRLLARTNRNQADH